MRPPSGIAAGEIGSGGAVAKEDFSLRAEDGSKAETDWLGGAKDMVLFPEKNQIMPEADENAVFQDLVVPQSIGYDLWKYYTLVVALAKKDENI